MTIADNLTALASQKLGYQDSVEACKVSLANKDVVVPAGAKLADISGLIDEIQQGGGDPSTPVGVGQHLVTFYDFDGKVLKRERVATGGNATAPDTPTHQYLTFEEWNNPFTNVQSDIDTGAIYNTTDGKTYLFITLTPVTGFAPTLYFSKNSTSLMTIDWGDGTTSTSTTSRNQTINHVYSSAGDYIITIDNSAGGTWTAGHGNAATALFSNGIYSFITNKIYFGNNIDLGANVQSQKIKYISFGTYGGVIGSIQNCNYLESVIMPFASIVDYGYRYLSSLKVFIIKNTNTSIGISAFDSAPLKSIKLPSTVTEIKATAFINALIEQYIFLSTTPPTLANINVFIGINPICKIYVPDASVEAYKTATNWNNYSSYIYPLSQKPQSDE